jgi:DNA processing protein
MSELFNHKLIGIIGSRKANYKELSIAYKISQDLSNRENIIVSGLARGIDTQAHKGALDSSNPFTVAILSICQNENIYPPENLTLSQDINQYGLIIYPYDTPCSKSNNNDYHTPFQKRLIERSILISYITDSIIVISDNDIIKGGTRWACQYALKQEKKVIQIHSDFTYNKNIKVAPVNLYWKPEINFEMKAKEIINEIRRGYNGNKRSGCF